MIRNAVVAAAFCMTAATAQAAADTGVPPPANGGRSTATRRDVPPVPEAERQSLQGWISFISDRRGAREVHLARPSTGAVTALARAADTASYNGPFTPDGSALLVMDVKGRDGPSSLRLWPLGEGSRRTIGPPLRRIRAPSFTPDGRFLVFESSGTSVMPAYFADIYRVQVSSGKLEQLTRNREGNFEPAVAPVGNLVVHGSSRDQASELYAMTVDGKSSRRLTHTARDEWNPVFSGDGRRLAFVSDREGADRIWLVDDIDRFDARRLTRLKPDPASTESQPVWSPSGDRIAYVLALPGRSSAVHIRNLNDGTEISLGDNGPAGTQSDPTWSPDGRHLAMTVTTSGDETIWLARADGSAWSPLLTASATGRADSADRKATEASAAGPQRTDPPANADPAHAHADGQPAGDAQPRGEWHPIWGSGPRGPRRSP